jgi:hypothetical protein
MTPAADTRGQKLGTARAAARATVESNRETWQRTSGSSKGKAGERACVLTNSSAPKKEGTN